MMLSLVMKNNARRSAVRMSFLSSRSVQYLVRSLSTAVSDVPSYMKYLDNILDKADRIDATVQEIRDTHAQQRPGVVADLANMDPLLRQLDAQRKTMEKEVADLKKMIQHARRFAVDPYLQEMQWEASVGRGRYSYAVHAPDGQSDSRIQEEVQELLRMTDIQSTKEDRTAIEELHRQQLTKKQEDSKFFAVDGPDGESDVQKQDDIKAANQIIEDEDAFMYRMQYEASIGRGRFSAQRNLYTDAIFEDERMKRRRQCSSFAVDAPDGVSDGNKEEEQNQVDQMIEDEAAYMQRMQYEASIGRGRFSFQGTHSSSSKLQ